MSFCTREGPFSRVLGFLSSVVLAFSLSVGLLSQRARSYSGFGGNSARVVLAGFPGPVSADVNTFLHSRQMLGALAREIFQELWGNVFNVCA